MPYSLGQVLAIGQIHPFYNSEFEYPPNPEAVQTLQAQETEDADDIELNSFGILSKKALYISLHRNSRPNKNTNPCLLQI